MTLVSTVTVGAGGAASIEFTGIPQTATDLLVVLSGRSTDASTSDSVFLTFNNSSSSYSYRNLYGTGSATGSLSNSGLGSMPIYRAINAANATAKTYGNTAIYVPNYAGSTAKSVSADGVNENNATAAEQFTVAGLWSGTSAITSLKLTPGSGTNFTQYSTASLYTITKGSGGATVS